MTDRTAVILQPSDWELVVEALAIFVLEYRGVDYERAERAWSVIELVAAAQRRPTSELVR
jgi:hypothetical protein